ncbi:glycoside hydrolase [Sphingomonas piscis]|uniref:Glycoside hydrolase n=2 Tax=Sphingomonas piscis TaxID=2714943 RepID=A0A6G7YT52_9SPHN|nr:glycoside hydrolase [Sphingomonas piscis]
MVFNDYYPEGHQTGVTIIQHGKRVAANGDIRLEPSPGQWSAMPKTVTRNVDRATNTISQTLTFPNPEANRKGFNPVFYPNIDVNYKVRVTPLAGNSFRINVDLDKPIPAEWVGKIGFNFELLPIHYWGKSFLMDGQSGIFPRQPNGPVVAPAADAPKVEVPVPVQPNGPVTDLNTEPEGVALATGRKLVVAADDDQQRMTFQSSSGAMELIDGRLNHNNGWFIVREPIPAGKTTNALEWVVTPHVQPNWKYEPVIQVSQVGYAPNQPKKAVFELDPSDANVGPATLYRLTENGREQVMQGVPQQWGDFLRYKYRTLDFSNVTQPGMYVVSYGGKSSHPFKIGADVYSRHVWQPTLEVFLPAQMCHMRVHQKYRVWHAHDHLDDALMAPTNLNHFDGYASGPSTLTKYKPYELVPGLDAGGWHDAGDYDMRVESQIGTMWLLAKMVEEFGLDYDATTIDQKRKLVEIHTPDGKNDAVQQLEHGLLSVMGGYRSMGRLYRGIIEPTHRQYVMLGQAENQSDNVWRKPVEGLGKDASGNPIPFDDRWVFTEDNPNRELYAAAGLAASARVMKASNPAFAAETLAAARDLTAKAMPRGKSVQNKVFALAELLHATGDQAYARQIVAMEKDILGNIEDSAWRLAPVLGQIRDAGFKRRLDAAVAAYQATVKQSARTDSPYGVPYKPDIWGAGWTIQERGVRQYFFHKGWPQHTDPQSWVSALNFVLGVHPGENTNSFVSGVGAKSATVAYGTNRADFSYIPGGVISGTALIRPDLPELKEWPFFWQQTEYVMGGGETNYMFLALAADRLYGKGGAQ